MLRWLSRIATVRWLLPLALIAGAVLVLGSPLLRGSNSSNSFPNSFPNSVWERPAAKLCLATAEPKQRLGEVRSQTEFGNEAQTEFGNEAQRLPPRIAISAADVGYTVKDGEIVTDDVGQTAAVEKTQSSSSTPGKVDTLEISKAYERANKLSGQAQGRVFKTTITPHWFHNNARFWYRNDLAEGTKEFIVVDAEKGARGPAFDHEKAAASLSKAAGGKYQPNRLPFSSIEFVEDGKAIRFDAADSTWRCDLSSYDCTRLEKAKTESAFLHWLFPDQAATTKVESPAYPPADEIVEPEELPDDAERSPEELQAAQKKGKQGGKQGAKQGSEQKQPLAAPGSSEAKSPDGKWVAFVKTNNVWLRDNDGKETQITQDGIEGNAYGAVSWSPDSKAFLFYRTEPGDNKHVYLIASSPSAQLAAKFYQRPYPRPGDKFSFHEMWVLDVDAMKANKVDVERIDFGPNANAKVPPVRWSKDNKTFTFQKTDRGHQRFRIIEVEALSGKTRNILDEKAETMVDHYTTGRLLQYLDETGEILYTSEMDGWKHIYLIDAKAGKIKNQITKGEWVVRGVDRVDVKNRQIWFRGSGKNFIQDPYLIHFYRVNFDGSELTALTEGNGNHSIEYSPDGKYLIDTYSRVDMAPVHELRKVSDGTLVCGLEKADVSALEAVGWRYPEVFVAKGRDGKTDIWGIVCRPQNFDPNKNYPVIEYIYAGPHSSFTPKTFEDKAQKGPFQTAALQMRALAELGFIVVQMDGMGTGNRSRAFHDVCWKNLADSGFPDRILWIKALAKRYAYVDISRVGIYGTSAGGQSSTGGLLFHPEFYKVAVSSCGCHDNRLDKSTWNEAWMGLMGPHYEAQSNVTNAKNLVGRLLLIVSELDTNVPPESTMRVVDELIRAKKDFDLIVMPGLDHGGGGAYGDRRRWDFFVRHLLGVEPPERNAVVGKSGKE